MIAIFSGFIAGAGHVLAGPDHLSAVAPLSVNSRKNNWAVGIRWGLGHSGGVLLIGILSLLFREVLPVDLVSSWSERLVGVMLIGIGIWGLTKAFGGRVHTHEHSHDGETHVHFHVHNKNHAHSEHRHTHAAFAVGTLHGLAGSSHFLGVLPALAFAHRVDAIGYLVAFAIGTIVAMAFFSSVIGFAARRVGGMRAYQTAMAGCSGSAFAVGIYWLAT